MVRVKIAGWPQHFVIPSKKPPRTDAKRSHKKRTHRNIAKTGKFSTKREFADAEPLEYFQKPPIWCMKAQTKETMSSIHMHLEDRSGQKSADPVGDKAEATPSRREVLRSVGKYSAMLAGASTVILSADEVLAAPKPCSQFGIGNNGKPPPGRCP